MHYLIDDEAVRDCQRVGSRSRCSTGKMPLDCGDIAFGREVIEHDAGVTEAFRYGPKIGEDCMTSFVDLVSSGQFGVEGVVRGHRFGVARQHRVEVVACDGVGSSVLGFGHEPSMAEQ